MMRVGLPYFLSLAAVLFSLGIYGAISKKSAVSVMMSLELIAIAININLVAFSRFVTPAAMSGQFFAAFMMVISAAEVGIGLALVLALYKQTKTIELDRVDELKG